MCETVLLNIQFEFFHAMGWQGLIKVLIEGMSLHMLSILKMPQLVILCACLGSWHANTDAVFFNFSMFALFAMFTIILQ